MQSNPFIEAVFQSPVHLSFIEILQEGFMLPAMTGTSIRDVLCNQWGVENEYLDHRINTVFLDGKPVDNVDSAVIADGSVLALSASMPGFVGAALRKGGFYAPMRSGITYTESAITDLHARCIFTLKLFNLVAEELGSSFLMKGVWLPSASFREFLCEHEKSLSDRCLHWNLNDQNLDLMDLLNSPAWKDSELVRFRVSISD
jgi:hypothetical protein